MLDFPSVSIVTPTRNRVSFLREAMASVRAQTWSDWEHIIVDDGSDDGTAEEVRASAAADPRVRYVVRRGDRSGANVCRNLGIRESHAGLVILLDADDLLAPHGLRQRVEVMQRHRDLDFAVFPGWVFTDRPQGERLFSPSVSGDDLDRVLFLDHPWQTSGPIWRRAALTRIGLLDERLPSWQDVDLHFRALVAGLAYRKFDTPDYHVRWAYGPEKTSVRQFQSPEHLRSGTSLVHDFHRRLVDAGLLTDIRRRALAGLFFLLGECWMRLGHAREARRTWFTAYRLGLTSLAGSLLGLQVLLAFQLRLIPADYNERLLERFKIAAGFRFQPER